MKTCRQFQKLLAHRLDSGAALDDADRRHLESCPACRALDESERRLVERLTAESQSVRTEPTPFLHGRIMAAIDRTGAQPAKPLQTGLPILRWLAATGVVALAGVLLILQLLPPSNQSDPVSSPAAAGTVPGIGHLPFSVDELAEAARLSDQITLDKLGRSLDEPLEKELRLVVQDAKAAVDLLAHNFLPERLQAWQSVPSDQ